jgi:DNA-binding response OmpR family regulator
MVDTMAHRLLLGEANPEIAGMMAAHFAGQGYEVEVTANGPQALETARRSVPSLIILSLSLPGTDGAELCHQLRTTPRTSHLPIIFLAERHQHDEMMAVLKAGADDCVIGLFDLQELSLRVANAIARRERENLTDPRSGLPGARLVQDALDQVHTQGNWSCLQLDIEHFEPFREVNGFVAADQVLQATAILLREVVAGYGSDQDFIGHPGDDVFIVITHTADVDALTSALVERFNQEALAHYSFMDREAGFITVYRGDEVFQEPLMSLSIHEIPRERLYRE